jgi:hypothetical protein
VVLLAGLVDLAGGKQSVGVLSPQEEADEDAADLVIEQLLLQTKNGKVGIEVLGYLGKGLPGLVEGRTLLYVDLVGVELLARVLWVA